MNTLAIKITFAVEDKACFKRCILIAKHYAPDWINSARRKERGAAARSPLITRQGVVSSFSPFFFLPLLSFSRWKKSYRVSGHETTAGENEISHINYAPGLNENLTAAKEGGTGSLFRGFEADLRFISGNLTTKKSLASAMFEVNRFNRW